MSAACDRFYGQVVNKTLSHDADARLAQHLANAAVLAMEGTRLEPEEVTPYFAVF
jgi:hypothetical protein